MERMTASALSARGKDRAKCLSQDGTSGWSTSKRRTVCVVRLVIQSLTWTDPKDAFPWAMKMTGLIQSAESLLALSCVFRLTVVLTSNILSTAAYQDILSASKPVELCYWPSDIHCSSDPHFRTMSDEIKSGPASVHLSHSAKPRRNIAKLSCTRFLKRRKTILRKADQLHKDCRARVYVYVELNGKAWVYDTDPKEASFPPSKDEQVGRLWQRTCTDPTTNR